MSVPTNTRPPTTAGCAKAEVPPGKPNAHFNFRLGTLAALRPAAVAGWKRVFAKLFPQPFQSLSGERCRGGFALQWFGIDAESPACLEPRNWPDSDSATRRRSASVRVSPTDFMRPVVRAV